MGLASQKAVYRLSRKIAVNPNEIRTQVKSHIHLRDVSRRFPRRLLPNLPPPQQHASASTAHGSCLSSHRVAADTLALHRKGLPRCPSLQRSLTTKRHVECPCQHLRPMFIYDANLRTSCVLEHAGLRTQPLLKHDFSGGITGFRPRLFWAI